MRTIRLTSLALGVLVFLSACSRDDSHGWLGYAEGENVLVAAPQAGWIASLHVKRGDEIRVGKPLFTLDTTREAAERAQAEATLAQTRAQEVQAKATLEYAAKEYSRQQGLQRAGAGVPANLDLAKSNYAQAKANVAQIEAQQQQSQALLAQSSYKLSQREITSLTKGRVEDIYFREGEFAPAGAAVISILPPANIYVRFFVPESQFARVKIGQRVRITCDGCGNGTIATITFIAQQQEFTPPVIFSINNREKLVFKLEARAAGGMKLNPGQPVEVSPLSP